MDKWWSQVLAFTLFHTVLAVSDARCWPVHQEQFGTYLEQLGIEPPTL